MNTKICVHEHKYLCLFSLCLYKHCVYFQRSSEQSPWKSLLETNLHQVDHFARKTLHQSHPHLGSHFELSEKVCNS